MKIVRHFLQLNLILMDAIKLVSISLNSHFLQNYKL